MEALNHLLDKIKERRSLKSDAALARELGVTRSAVSLWRTGKSLPDAVACAQIADITGEPLNRVIGLVNEARAISPSEKAVWRRLAQAASWAAAAVLGTALTLAPAPVRAAVLGPHITDQSMHYASWRRRLRGWLSKRHTPFPH